MEWEGEREREQEQKGEAENRLMEELEQLITTPPVPPFDAGGTNSFDNLHLNFHRPNTEPQPPESASESNVYREKLRSYSSFPAATTLSDTTSQCTNTNMIDSTMLDHSLSDGDNVCRSHLHPQPRHRRRSHTSKSKTHITDPEAAPSRRFYVCDVCGHKFPSPQSLGGHKNVHKSKGRFKPGISSRRRGQAGLGSNSSGSDVASSLYKGVRCREREKWVTEIRPPKSSDVKWWLGTFPSAEEAAQAYDVALAFFKSESEMNFSHHPLYQKLPPLPPDLSSQEYAQRLREMVREISAQIIAERRLEEQAASSIPLGGASVSPAGSSSDAAPAVLPLEDELADLPDFDSDLSAPASELEWIRFLNLQ